MDTSGHIKKINNNNNNKIIGLEPIQVIISIQLCHSSGDSSQ